MAHKRQVAKCFVWDSKKEKLLILLRGAKAPRRPLQWDLPGGVVDSGEEPVDTARREVTEESGLEVAALAEVCRQQNMVESLDGTVNDVQWLYFEGQAKSNDVKISWEHDEYKWVTPEEYLNYVEYQLQRDAFKELDIL